MTLADNNAVQLWRKAEADLRDAVNLMMTDPGTEPGEHVRKLLTKLRSATAAVQELERKMIVWPPANYSMNLKKKCGRAFSAIVTAAIADVTVNGCERLTRY